MPISLLILCDTIVRKKRRLYRNALSISRSRVTMLKCISRINFELQIEIKKTRFLLSRLTSRGIYRLFLLVCHKAVDGRNFPDQLNDA